MEYFMRNAGRVLSRTQILEDVWDRNIFCPTNTVDVHVSSLRTKLSAYNCDSFIKTVHCVGYIFD
jgi:DNA-binding response OmpR family regulator